MSNNEMAARGIGPRSAAETYLGMDWQPVPLGRSGSKDGKACKIKGWTKRKFTPEDFQDDHNIGILLGKPSGGLVAVDFDCDATRRLAAVPDLLPLTWTDGRAGRISHAFYDCGESAGKKVKFTVTDPNALSVLGFTADVDVVTMVEVLADGQQVMVWPSIHESGEMVKWTNRPAHQQDGPNQQDFGDVVKTGGLVAFLGVVMLAWPKAPGQRDDIAMAFTGALLDAGLPTDRVDFLVGTVARLAGDDEPRGNKAEMTARKKEEGEPVTGLTTLCQLLQLEGIQADLRKWLRLTTSGDSVAAPPATDNKLIEMNDLFAVVHDLGGKCRVIQEVWDDGLKRFRLARFNFEDFRNRFMNHKVMVPQPGTDANGNPKPPKPQPLGKWWLEHPQRREYTKLAFVPGGPREIVSADGTTAYNLWQGFNYEPEPGNLHDKFLAHLHDNVCQGNTGYYEYLINWMAAGVQRPGEPGQVAVVLRGRQGTGKGFTAKTIGALFGRHSLAVTNPKHLVGGFNAHLMGCCWLFADEAFVAGNKEHASILKSLITEPTVMIEAKGIDPIEMPNYLHLILSSNEDWVVDVDPDDRRLFVLDVGDDQARATLYFGAMQKDLDAGGYGHLLHFLLERDLSAFDVQAQLPNTLAKDDQKTLKALRVPAVKRQHDWLANGGPLPESSEAVSGQLWVETSALAEILDLDPVAMGKLLRAIGNKPYKHKRTCGYLLPLDLVEARDRWRDLSDARGGIRWPKGEWQIELEDGETPF